MDSVASSRLEISDLRLGRSLHLIRTGLTHTLTYTMSERAQTHNFAAGPSPLPTSVLEEASRGLLNYNNTGMGICELSHRGKEFKAIIEGAEGRSWQRKP